MANRWASIYGKQGIIGKINMENTKGVALVRMEDGKKVYQPKIAYLRMKKAGRNVELIAEAPTRVELDKILARV